MRERQSPTITIKRGDTPILTVPITEGCTRNFQLMEEDCISLSFDLDNPVRIAIGDYIDDELFGRFVVREEQMPRLNTTTAGYTYTLQLEAWYRMWQNKTFMLTTVLHDAAATRIRKEAQWDLTQNLREHIYEYLLNLQLLGYIDPNMTDQEQLLARYVDIQDQHVQWQKVHHIQYSATMMIDALSKMAELWECEWWVTGTPQDFMIHLGKCETGQQMTFSEDNMEGINLQPNVSRYANKIYVYGSTQNIPASYRRQAILTITDIDRSTNLLYTDHQLTADMFPTERVTDLTQGAEETSSDTSYVNISNFTTIKQKNNFDLETIASAIGARITASRGIKTNSYYEEEWYSFDDPDNPKFEGTIRSYTTQLNIDTRLVLEDAQQREILRLAADQAKHLPCTAGYREYYDTAGNLVKSEIDQDVDVLSNASITIPDTQVNATIASGRYRFRLLVNYSTIDYFPSIQAAIITTRPTQLRVNITTSTEATSTTFMVERSGQQHLMVCNPDQVPKYAAPDEPRNPDYSALCLVDDEIQRLVIPDDFQIGDKIIVSENDNALLPTAYFTNEYDTPSSLTRISERRLQLPIAGGQTDGWVCRDGYIIRSDLADNPESIEVVEDTIAFDDIYPEGLMQVKTVMREPARDETSYGQEQIKDIWQWNRYHIQLQMASGAAFPFREEYTLDGQTLSIKFDIQHPDTSYAIPITAENCKMAGMTFGVSYEQSRIYEDIDTETTETHREDYAIVRNEDYGSRLPNEQLRPQVGDPCILINWNVRMINDLGLIDTAEQRLMQRGFEYAQAIEDDQFTAECTLMSEYAFSLIDKLSLSDSDCKALFEYNGLRLYVRNRFEAYALPAEGHRIIIRNPAFKGGAKASRIIGYQLKLDKPYDTPRFTVGETQAYSRLAKIEREITRIQ